MLVEINTQVGGVSTDQKSRYHNFMAALHATATAAAGATPVINPVNSSGTKDTNYNCVTVLSNAEAGGWSTGTANNITASSTMNPSSGTLYLLDLYTSSGKTSFPYYRVGFQQAYAFNSSFTSYPFNYSYCGHSDKDPTTVPFNGDTTLVSGSCGGLNPSVTSPFSGTSYPYMVYPRVDLDFASQTTLHHQKIYVACTSSYLIIMTPYDIWYFGTRTVSPWELGRTDNPPWVSFGWSTGNGSIPSYYPSSAGGNHYFAWTSLISPDLTTTSAARRLGRGEISDSITSYGHHFTGWQSGNNFSQTPAVTANTYLNPATHALLYIHSAYYGTGISPSYPARWDGPVTDTVTGQQVPPAYPLWFSAMYDVSTGNPATTYQTSQGIIKGILRGPSSTPTGLNAMLTASDYVIGSSTYVPIRIGPGNGTVDCFYIRKA